MAIVVQKYGGTSVGDPERIRAVARRIIGAQAARGPRGGGRLRHGRTSPTSSSTSRAQISAEPAGPRDGHAAGHRRAGHDRPARDGDPRRGPRGGLRSPARRRASSPTPSHTQGADRRTSAPTASAKRSPQGSIVIVAGFQGMTPDGTITTLGRGGSRHHRRRRRRGHRRRRLRDLHRRRRRLHRRPAHRPRRPQDRRHLLRGDARDGRRAARGVLQLRCVEFARNHGVVIHCRSSFNDSPGTIVKEADAAMEAGDHLGRHARHVRGEGHAPRRARPPRRGRGVFTQARRGERQRRHDHPERVRGGHDGHLVHDAEGRPDPGTPRGRRPSSRSSAHATGRWTNPSPRSRSWAPA